MICDHKKKNKKAEPAEMIECSCRKNKRCTVCGYEIRKIPCLCGGKMRPKMSKRFKNMEIL